MSSSSEVAPPPLDLAPRNGGGTSHTSSSSTSGSSPTRSSPQLSSEDSLPLHQGEYGNNRTEHNNNNSDNNGGTDLHVIPPSSNLLLRTTTEMLRAASGVPVNNNNNNNRARPRGGVEASLPMNLSVKKPSAVHVNGGLLHPVVPPPPSSPSSPPALHHFPAHNKAYNPGVAVAKLLKGNGAMPMQRKVR